ncbi:MAG TPA: amidase family protein [Steroidobacteraceae bacterium]|nr:amidase family protein [Steroidobacteraceae bacterium]
MGRVLIRLTLLWASILLCTVGAATQQTRASGAFDPAGATIPQLRAALDSGAISDIQLVRYYLDRIKRFDKSGPRINALINLNVDALEQARRIDAELKIKSSRSMLFGIPFIVKDNFNTAGIPTSAGSAALKHSVPPRNAAAVQKLLDQRAILIGKANMSELASSYGRLGYSSAGGLTLNPYNTSRNVSGSSSGSAAAVAADFAAFALGTDTSGSIRGPANVAGLFGLRPTRGLISRGGVVPLSPTFDTVGILARTPQDVAIVLDTIAGPDATDAATLDGPRSQVSYADGIDHGSLRGVRLGVVGNFRGGNDEVDGAEQDVLKTLTDQGAVLIPIALPNVFEHLWDSVMGPVGRAELRPQLERYLRTLPAGQPKTLAELIHAGDTPRERDSSNPINPALLKALREAQASDLTDSPTYNNILTQLLPSLRQELRALMASQNLRALVFSTMSCPASPRFDTPDPHYICRSDDSYKASYIAATVGFPEVTVPVAQISNTLPVGYSVLGMPHSEAQLLGLANAMQQALRLARGPLPGPSLQ